MSRLRCVAIATTGAVWAYCLIAHILVAARFSPPIVNPVIAVAVGVAASWVLWWPYRGSPFPDDHVASYVVVLMAASLLCLMWPMVVGSGVANTHPLAIFSDTGVPTGDPGDRYLNSHSRRVRALSEEEYQQTQRWSKVQMSAMSAGFSGMILGYVLHMLSLGLAPRPAPAPPPGSLPATPSS